MLIVSKGYSNIEKGYQKIIELEKKLAQSWENQIEEAIKNANVEYQNMLSQWETECSQVTEHNIRRKEELEAKVKPKKIARNISGILFVSLIFFLGPLFFWWLASLGASALIAILMSLIFCTASLLFMISPIVFLVLFFNVRSMEKSASNSQPLPPKPVRQHSPHPSGWLSLRTEWKNRLGGRLESGNYGEVGEKRLVKNLAYQLSDEYICLVGILVARNLDADAVIIGPKGIWVFESKYFSGEITLLNGQWSRYKQYFLPGGYPEYKTEYLDSFDEQWVREKAAIQTTLRKKFQSSYFQPLIEEIKGGLVFTHDNVILKLDGSSKAPYGNINSWINQLIETSPRMPLTINEAQKIADILIDYSKQLEADKPFSSVDLATNIFVNAENRIKTFCAKYNCD